MSNESDALRRLSGALDERDRRTEGLAAAGGSEDELPARVELQAAEDQLAARERWLEWVRDER